MLKKALACLMLVLVIAMIFTYCKSKSENKLTKSKPIDSLFNKEKSLSNETDNILNKNDSTKKGNKTTSHVNNNRYNWITYQGIPSKLAPIERHELINIIDQAFEGAKKEKRLNQQAVKLFHQACIHMQLKNARMKIFEYDPNTPTEGINPSMSALYIAGTYHLKNNFEIYLDMLSNLYLLKNHKAQKTLSIPQQFLAELVGLEIIGSEIGEQDFKQTLTKYWRKKHASVPLMSNIARNGRGLEGLYTMFSEYPGDQGTLAAHIFYMVKPTSESIGGEEKNDKAKKILEKYLNLKVEKTKTYIKAQEHFYQFFTEERIKTVFDVR